MPPLSKDGAEQGWAAQYLLCMTGGLAMSYAPESENNTLRSVEE